MSELDALDIHALLLDHRRFLDGSLDLEAHFCTWRYAEAPSFADSFALEIAPSMGVMQARHCIYPVYTLREQNPKATGYEEQTSQVRVAVVSQSMWRDLQQEMTSLSYVLPSLPDWRGKDGVSYSLRFGDSQQYVLFKWWSEYSDEFRDIVALATKWRDRLLRECFKTGRERKSSDFCPDRGANFMRYPEEDNA